ncbi:hypothetical protein MCEMRE195_00016 [Candidatus Nanopelagicaceae bacterium]
MNKFLAFAIVGTVILSGCGQSNSDSNSFMETQASDIQARIDEACALAAEAFSLEGNSNIGKGESLFDQAGKMFRDLVVEYPLAEKYMKGSLAASNEFHRYFGSGYSVYRASQEGHYISKDDGDAIIATYEYCLAGAD